MNKDVSIEFEIRALLNNFWILKENQPELYYSIKKKQDIIKNFVMKNLGSKLIFHDRFIKLEKLPQSLDGSNGLSSFILPLDYVILCLVLLFLEDKMRGEFFTLSNLIDYVKNTAITMELDNVPNWDLARDRRSLLRVIDFLEDKVVIKTLDQEKTSFKDNQNTEALYQATGLSNYVMRLFNNDIFSYQQEGDFLRDEWVNQEEDKGDVRRFKVYRNLMYTPASFSSEMSLSELDYIKKLRGHMDSEFKSLGYTLEVTRNMAFLYEYETNQSKSNFPNNKKISDIVLMVNKKLYEMILNEEIILDDTEIGFIKKESLEVLFKNIKNNEQIYLSKYFNDLPFDKFFEEVTDYMVFYSFLRNRDDCFEIMPSIARFQGKLVRMEENNQIGLFGGEIDV